MHKKVQCGIYEFGLNVSDVLKNSIKFKFIKVECESIDDLRNAIKINDPSVIIYNYHPSVMPWLATKVLHKWFKNNVSNFNLLQIGIIHEITQSVADTATNYKNTYLDSDKLINSLFDFYIAPDPTLLLQNQLVYKTGRLIPKYVNDFPLPPKVTIGSFGFGTPKKGFEKIVDLVQNEFDEANIRFNIPFAEFGDKNGAKAKAIAANCMSKINKPGIHLTITHDFQDKKSMLDFLAQNTINVFLYEDTGSRGLSSTVDNALAVKRPIAISNSIMFRHVFDVRPSICVNNNSLKNIIENGFLPLEKKFEEYSPENLLWEYERILTSIFYRTTHLNKIKRGFKQTISYKINRLLSLQNKTFTWLRNSHTICEDLLTIDKNACYHIIDLPNNAPLNRILNDEARTIYKPAIEMLTRLVPKTMEKKIAEANVQQAFVFDTVHRFISEYQNPKILCVGSYEDTASMSLIRMGYKVEEIDPMINYSLKEYIDNPNITKNSYNIIFSTSVIEHEPDDKSFIECVAALLALSGIAIITCDYKDGWQPNELKPVEDERFYTKKDLEKRLLSYVPNCGLVDIPKWDCPNPDFNYLGKYQYTFATFVIRKKSI